MIRIFLFVFVFLTLSDLLTGQEKTDEVLFEFGTVIPLERSLDLNSDRDEKVEKIKWVQVNTDEDTWRIENDILINKGLPIGVVRSSRQFENYILHVEWMHLEPGGNSGMFMWSSAVPGKNRLPNGIEVQMLELDWVKLNAKDGVEQPIAYVHGEMWGVDDVDAIPDNPRGIRSKSLENRCKGRGEWNTYDVVCVDGTVKLAVNGKFVNGVRESSQRKGFMCLEAEGAEIRFRNLKVIELPGGLAPSLE